MNAHTFTEFFDKRLAIRSPELAAETIISLPPGVARFLPWAS